MTEQTYRLVFSDPDGARPIATTPSDRDNALALFGVLARASIFGPHGTERMRVVDEPGWLAIRAAAGRRPS